MSAPPRSPARGCCRGPRTPRASGGCRGDPRARASECPCRSRPTSRPARRASARGWGSRSRAGRTTPKA
eukprot:11186642-Lingulodinium_polyedra.AAC.1